MNLKYEIIKDYLPVCKISPRRRAGIKMDKVRFLVAHDTGNLNSTAKGNVKYFKDTYNKDSASAHLFVDDKEIIECVPAFENSEKAWHVWYSCEKDNQVYGDDANDVAIGVELCFFTDKKRSEEAYIKYVWLLAYLCYFYKLNPQTDIIGHEVLDPKRKIDPSNGLRYSGHTFKDLINDVQNEYDILCEEDKVEELSWKQKIVKEAFDLELLKSNEWINKAEAKGDVWFICAMMINLYEKLKK